MIESATELVVGKVYRGTVTDCCVPGIRFQAPFLGEDDEELLFRTSCGTEIKLYAWALPNNLEEVK